MFLTVSRILALFNISPARDAEGQEIEPVQKMSGGGITYATHSLYSNLNYPTAFESPISATTLQSWGPLTMVRM